MDERLIAWHGTVEIINAMWSLDTGRTVELRLTGESYDRVHPFKRFQKKRNGRVGTRFSAAFSRIDTGDQVLSMEVMLMSWKDASSIGQSITLWLDNEVETHPFCGCSRRKASIPGDVFALVLVELNDDDSPVRQNEGNLPGPGVDAAVQTQLHDGSATPPGAAAPGASNGQAARGTQADPKGPPARGAATTQRRLSSKVHLLVTSPIFVRWLQETKSTLVAQWTPELARRYAKQVLEVESLSDLDRNPAAVERFHLHIRRPYERWYRQEP